MHNKFSSRQVYWFKAASLGSKSIKSSVESSLSHNKDLTRDANSIKLQYENFIEANIITKLRIFKKYFLHGVTLSLDQKEDICLIYA